MKKNKKVIIIIIILILGFLTFKQCNGTYYTPNFFANVNYVKDFKKYEKDYESLINFAIQYKEHFTNPQFKDYIYIDKLHNKVIMYNNDTDEEIKVNKKIQQSLNNIYESFCYKDYPFDRIDFNGDFVMFGTDKTIFAIVYSPDGKKPKGYGLENDEDYDFYVKKLDKNWYTIKGIIK